MGDTLPPPIRKLGRSRMITQTGLLPIEVPLVDGSNHIWRVIGAATSATAAAVLLAYCFQPLIHFAYLLFLLSS